MKNNIVNDAMAELKDTVDDIKKDNQDINKLVNDSDEVTEDDKSLEMYNVINGTVIKVLEDKSVAEAFVSIKEKCGADLSKELIEVMTAAITIAAYNAIAYYDMELKDIIFENFQAAGDEILQLKSKIEFLEKSFGDFKKDIDLEKLNKLYNA